MSTIKITPELLAEARATYVGKFTEELARAIIASADPGAAAVRRETGTEHGIDLGRRRRRLKTQGADLPVQFVYLAFGGAWMAGPAMGDHPRDARRREGWVI